MLTTVHAAAPITTSTAAPAEPKNEPYPLECSISGMVTAATSAVTAPVAPHVQRRRDVHAGDRS
jgi:crotonobetainyl-CoA:carnitine CoA-transferase CaiB-like acyl-CoA transferase